MRARRYSIYDVFTDRPLAGNPLAVVFDSDGLDDHAMQAIAREFNLSETVFLSPPASPQHTAAVRIFTPAIELPFAGHPTVGAAIALFQDQPNSGAAVLVLEEKVGPVRCAVKVEQGKAFAEFGLPRLPSEQRLAVEPAVIASALGLAPHEIGFENHRPAIYSAGVPYVLVPVQGLDAAGRVRVDVNAWRAFAPVEVGVQGDAYVYCRETVAHDASFHARMFGPETGIPEDPATGSAVAALVGQIVARDALRDGRHAYRIEQGVEMGRPSLIQLEIDVAHGRATAARIGGNAVKIAEGKITV
jgi:trans-2,3-dihydro-3-hydroxyanthranilate isomerase